MTEKIMKVFYDANGLPYKDKAREVHYPLVGSAFMGASNTTTIRFYTGLLGNSNDTWVSCAKLPNGELGYKLLSATYDSEEEEYYVSLSLTTFYTNYKGDVYIALQGYSDGVHIEEVGDTGVYKVVGTPTIQATGVIKLAMNYTPQISPTTLSENITKADIQEFLAAIGEGIGGVIPKINTSTISSYEFDINLYHENEIIFNDYDNYFYKLKVVSGNLKAQKVAELNVLTNGNGVLSANELRTGRIETYGGGDSFVDLDQNNVTIGIGATGEKASLQTPAHNFEIDEITGSIKMVSYEGGSDISGVKVYNNDIVSIFFEEDTSYINVGDDIEIGANGDITLIGGYVEKNGNEIANAYKLSSTTISTSGGSVNSSDRNKLRNLPTFILASVSSSHGTIDNVLFRQQSLGSKVYISETYRAGTFSGVGTDGGGIYLYQLKIEFASDFNTYSATLLTEQKLVNQDYVDGKISTVYKVQGSRSVAGINSMGGSETYNGYVYNLTDSGTLNNYSGTTSVNVGDNVVFVWNGGNWYWDKLAGTIDTSNFVLKTQKVSGIALSGDISSADLTDSLVFATNTDIDNLFE